MRQIQLEKDSIEGASIIVATVEDRLVKSPIDQGDGKNAKERIRHPGVADEFMRKPAELAPLHKELIHSIRNDGSVKLSKSMRELQRRWRNTVRIDEKLYAPDEMMDRAVLDNQGMEIGVITELVKIKRTYRAVVVKTRIGVQMQYGIDTTINIPITALARTRERLDEVVLSRTFDKLLGLPSYIQANDPDAIIEE